MKDRILKTILFGYVFSHLTLVTLSASYIDIADWVPGKNFIDFYKKASGADSSYGFFAPSIGVKTRALFDIIDQNGIKLADTPLVPESAREVELRLFGISDEFICKDADHSSLRQPLAASLAASILTRHANAAEVTLRVQEFWPVTMKEYRQGQRAGWKDYYAARFARSSNREEDAQ